MCEAAALLSVAIDSDGLAVQRLFDEARHNHAVLPGLPWPDGIEKPNDDYRQFGFHPMCQREEFVEGFCAGIAPAPGAGGSHDRIIIFTERDFGAFSIDFGG